PVHRRLRLQDHGEPLRCPGGRFPGHQDLELPDAQCATGLGRDVVTSSLKAAGGGGSQAALDPSMGTETIPQGSDPIGPIQVEPKPQLVIDPATGQGMYLQVVDAGPPGSPRGNLAFARRVGGSWSALATIPESSAVSSPVLALTNERPGDAVGVPMVV